MTSNKKLFKILFMGIVLFSSLFTSVIYMYQVSRLHRQKESYRVDNPVTTSNSEITETTLEKRKVEWNQLEAKLKNQKKAKNPPKIIAIGLKGCGINNLVQLLTPHPLIRINRNQGPYSFHDFNDAHVQKYIETLSVVEEDAFLIENRSEHFHKPPYNLPYFLKRTFPRSKLLLILCEPTQRVLNEWLLCKDQDHSSMGKYGDIERFLHAFIPFLRSEVGEYKQEWSDVDTAHKLYDLLSLQQRQFMSSVLTKSFYALHLSRWLTSFGHGSMMIMDAQDVHDDPGIVIEKIQDFLAIPKLLLKTDYIRNSSTGTVCYKHWKNQTDETFDCISNSFNNKTATELSSENGEELLNSLKKLYQSHNEALFNILGKRFSW